MSGGIVIPLSDPRTASGTSLAIKPSTTIPGVHLVQIWETEDGDAGETTTELTGTAVTPAAQLHALHAALGAYLGQPHSADEIAHLAADEATALAVAQTLRSRHGWSGTEFLRSDVTDHVREALADAGRVASEEDVAALVDQVMDGYPYRKLGDRFAELGNELLADAARDAVTGIETC